MKKKLKIAAASALMTAMALAVATPFRISYGTVAEVSPTVGAVIDDDRSDWARVFFLPEIGPEDVGKRVVMYDRNPLFPFPVTVPSPHIIGERGDGQ